MFVLFFGVLCSGIFPIHSQSNKKSRITNCSSPPPHLAQVRAASLSNGQRTAGRDSLSAF